MLRLFQMAFALVVIGMIACTKPLLRPGESQAGEDGRFALHRSDRDRDTPKIPFLTSHAGRFDLPQGQWVSSIPHREEAGQARQIAIQIPERLWRAALYECRLKDRHLSVRQIEDALGILFRLDARHDKAQIGKPLIFLPPALSSATDSASAKTSPTLPRPHAGLAWITDSSVVFVHIEAKDSTAMPRILAWADSAFKMSPRHETGTWADDVAQQRFAAALENTLGLKATEESHYDSAMAHYDRAFSLDSLNPRYLANIAALDQVKKQTSLGITRIESRSKLFAEEGASELHGVLGGLYEELGDYEKARRHAVKALELDPDNREWLINFSDALWGLGERVQSKNVLLGRYAKNPDFRLSVYLAGTYLGLEEYENARIVLEQAHATHGPDAKSAEYMLRAYIGLKDFGAAQGYVQSLGDTLPRSGMIHFLLGITAFNLKQYRTALKEVQEALREDPTHREAQELSTQITALLGGKSNQILRTPLQALKTQINLKQARARLKQAEVESIAQEYPLTLLEQHITFDWSPGRPWHKTRHQFFYIPNGKRLLQFSELNYELNPTSMRFYVNRFRLYDSALTPIEDSRARDFYVTGNHNTTLHPENLLVHLPIKARAGKHFLEVITTEASQVPDKEFPYVRFGQQAVYPMVHTRFDIMRPPANLLVSPRGECKIDSLPDRLSLTMNKPVLPLDKRFFSVPPEFTTGFSASAFATWREVGAAYWKTLDQAGMNPDSIPFAIRERAAEIVQANRSMPAMRSLFRYVRDSVRYNNYEFSLQAQIPDGSETVMQRSQGDCKGHALLLVQMLKAQGYAAHLFLVDQDHPGEPELPSLNQFNHMMVHVPAQKGKPAYFLDPTEKRMAFRRAPLTLEGRLGLIVDGEQSRLGTVPEIDSAGEHQAQVFHTFKVRDDGMAAGTDSVVLNGKLAAWFRDHYHSWNVATRMQTLMSWMSEGYPAFVDRGFSLLHADDPDEPLTLVFRYETRFNLVKGQREVEHVPKLEMSFLRFPPPQACRQPVYFANEVIIHSEWVYHLPGGYVWKTTDIDREVSANYLYWKFSIQQDVPESIRIRQQWKVDPFVATPEDYGRSYAEWGPILARSGLRLAASKP